MSRLWAEAHSLSPAERPALSQMTNIESEEHKMSNKYYRKMEQIEDLVKWPDHKMRLNEFLDSCTTHGGNWAAMFMSGLEVCFPELYASLPDDGTFDGILLMSIVSRVTEQD